MTKKATNSKKPMGVRAEVFRNAFEVLGLTVSNQEVKDWCNAFYAMKWGANTAAELITARNQVKQSKRVTDPKMVDALIMQAVDELGWAAETDKIQAWCDRHNFIDWDSAFHNRIPEVVREMHRKAGTLNPSSPTVDPVAPKLKDGWTTEVLPDLQVTSESVGPVKVEVRVAEKQHSDWIIRDLEMELFRLKRLLKPEAGSQVAFKLATMNRLLQLLPGSVRLDNEVFN